MIQRHVQDFFEGDAIMFDFESQNWSFIWSFWSPNSPGGNDQEQQSCQAIHRVHRKTSPHGLFLSSTGFTASKGKVDTKKQVDNALELIWKMSHVNNTKYIVTLKISVISIYDIIEYVDHILFWFVL